MARTVALWGLVVVLGVGLAAGQVLAQQAGGEKNPPAGKTPPAGEKKEQPPEKAPPAGEKKAEPGKQPGLPEGMSAEEMMKKYTEFATLDEHHGQLAKMVGNWSVGCRFWTPALPGQPEQPPMESTGAAVFKSILGGRFVTQEYKGTFMGQAFEGFGIDGYDKIKKKYVSVWMDNMSTAVLTALGECDAEGKVCTYEGLVDDPVTGEKGKKSKSVVRHVNDDKCVLEMYDTLPGGKEFKMMEMEYNRKK